MQNTQGANSDYYTDNELRTFLQRYFLGSLKVSDKLLVEIGRFKTMLLGGEPNKVTRAEFGNLKQILMIGRDESLRLLPHIRYLTMDVDVEQARQNPQKVETAIVEFNKSMAVLGTLLGHSKDAYNLENFATFLAEFEKFYSGVSAWTGPNWIIDRLPLISAMKAFFMRPAGDTIWPDEWAEFSVDAGKLYSLYLRYYYLLAHRDLLSGEGLDHFRRMLDEVFGVLESSVKAKQDRVIDYPTIDLLITELSRWNLLRFSKVKPTTIKFLVRSTLDRVFNPPMMFPNGKIPDSINPDDLLKGTAGYRLKTHGLTEANLARMRDGVIGWVEMQRLWRELETQAYARDSKLKGHAIPLKIVRQIWPTLAALTSYQRPFNDLNAIFQRQMPLSYTADGTIVFVRDPSKHVIDQDTFNSLNWKSHVPRALVLGYSRDPDASSMKGLSKDEWRDMFFDVRPLLVDLNMVAPNDYMLWSSLMTELNMFTLTADGDDRISYSEALDFISMAKSKSFMAQKMYGDLLVNCQHFELDIYGVPKVAPSCFRERVAKYFSTAYQNLPDWTKLVAKFDRNEWVAFERELELGARKKGYSDELIETTDVDRISMVLHYIETVFTRFDKDGSGDLSLAEAEKAYPLLRQTLADASGFTDEEDLKALFAYVLHYGEAPKRTAGGIFKWLNWKSNKDGWAASANRRTLLKIIGNLQNPQAFVEE
jgi:hypothetical protein